MRVRFISPSVLSVSGDGVKEWRDSKAIFIPGSQFSPAYKKHFWDGKKYLGTWSVKQWKLICGRGLLEQILTELPCTIEPPTNLPKMVSPGTHRDHELRDYQIEALATIFTRKWGRIAFATNAGKGAIIALASKNLRDSGFRTLILCDEIAVFGALKEEVEKWSGVLPDIIEAGRQHPPTGNIVLAMIPTLSRRFSKKWCKDHPNETEEWWEWFRTITAVMLDEADKATSPSWQNLLDRVPNTYYRIGFSGTFSEANTPNELVMMETIGPVLLRVTNNELIKRKISARPKVDLFPFQHYIRTRGVGYWEMKGAEKFQYIMDTLARNQHRNQLVVDLLEKDAPNAIIVNYIQHGHELARVVPNSEFLSGRDKPDRREEVLARFRNGTLQNLIVTRILDRGTNQLGKTVGLIFASGMGSDRQTLQRIGRGLRRADGKEFLHLKDIIDRGHDYLEDASRGRIELYDKEGFEVEIKDLPNTQLAYET